MQLFSYLYGNGNNFLKVYEYIHNKKILLIEDITGAFGGKIKKIFWIFWRLYYFWSKIIDMSGGGFISSNNESICTKIEKIIIY